MLDRSGTSLSVMGAALLVVVLITVQGADTALGARPDVFNNKLHNPSQTGSRWTALGSTRSSQQSPRRLGQHMGYMSARRLRSRQYSEHFADTSPGLGDKTHRSHQFVLRQHRSQGVESSIWPAVVHQSSSPQAERNVEIPTPSAQRCYERGLDAAWVNGSWVMNDKDTCQLLDLPVDAPDAISCLDGKTIAFVGDSHLRNLFRCVADQLTAGKSAEAVGNYTASLWDAEGGQPDEWPKYSHMDMQFPADSQKAGGAASEMHRLSCHNAYKVHRHDYTFEVAGSDGERVRLKFFWLPWGGSKPLIETPEVVEEISLDAAKYRFNYTGGRTRGTFLPQLGDALQPDLVISGGEARDHSALFETMASSAMLVNHAGFGDGLHEEAARYGVPMADVSNPLLSIMPDFHAPRNNGGYGVKRTRHPPPEVLQLQSRLLLTLAREKLCASGSQRTHTDL